MVELLWWEKTVEYRFLAEMLGGKKYFISPLDGRQEQAGDAMVSDRPDRWLLIEFKRDSRSLEDERKKFPKGKYEEAKTKLGKRDDHHFFVFGCSVTRSHGTAPDLGLLACTYFSRKPKKNHVLIDYGVDLNTYTEYIEEYVKLKMPDGPPPGPGGVPVTFGEFALVAGVSVGKGITCCMSLNDFLAGRGFALDDDEGQEELMAAY